MAQGNGFTPTQKRMLKVLSDGQRHTREELHACLDDELSALSAIQAHITYIRKHLEIRGEDIVCVARDRSYHYQHVRLLNSANDGRT